MGMFFENSLLFSDGLIVWTRWWLFGRAFAFASILFLTCTRAPAARFRLGRCTPSTARLWREERPDIHASRAVFPPLESYTDPSSWVSMHRCGVYVAKRGSSPTPRMSHGVEAFSKNEHYYYLAYPRSSFAATVLYELMSRSPHGASLEEEAN